MGRSPAAHDPSVAVRRRHLPGFAREENERAPICDSGEAFERRAHDLAPAAALPNTMQAGLPTLTLRRLGASRPSRPTR